MDTDNKIVREVYSIVSGNFLTSCIPIEYFDWTEEDQDKFLEDNTWEPFEYWSLHDVWDLIDSGARETYKWYCKEGNC